MLLAPLPSTEHLYGEKSPKSLLYTYLGDLPEVGAELETGDVAAVIAHDDDRVARVEGDVRQFRLLLARHNLRGKEGK